MKGIREMLYLMLALLLAIFALLLFELMDSKFSPDDVINICKKNGGVENVVPRYGGSREAAIVICKDGGIGWVK